MILLKIDNLIIAETHYDEFAETIELTRRAFWDLFQPGCDEHLLLARLRESACYIPELDMVAIEAGVIVGHALATVAAVKCVVPCADGSLLEKGGVCAGCRVICVGPVSVLPEKQKEGIGCKLLYHLLERADELGYDAAFLYGHPEYYPRFGFVNAKRYGITTRDGQNFDAFMALELSPGALSGITGRFVEDDAFHVT
ncbi:MAG: GNAT family N-acetyltransferase [Bacteroidales bacterium]